MEEHKENSPALLTCLVYLEDRHASCAPGITGMPVHTPALWQCTMLYVDSVVSKPWVTRVQDLSK